MSLSVVNKVLYQHNLLESPQVSKSQQSKENQSQRELRSLKRAKLSQKTNLKKKSETSTSPEARPQAQVPPTQITQADQAPISPTPQTTVSDAHRFYTDVQNSLSFSGDANKILNEIKSFQYVFLRFWTTSLF